MLLEARASKLCPRCGFLRQASGHLPMAKKKDSGIGVFPVDQQGSARQSSPGDGNASRNGSPADGGSARARHQKRGGRGDGNASASPPDGGSAKAKHHKRGRTGRKSGVPNYVIAIVVAIVAMALLKYAGEQDRSWGSLHSQETSSTSHYEALGVQRTATVKEIRSAYKVLAKKYHPDNVKTGCADCKDKFEAITAAYQVLSDPLSREAYDSVDADLKLIQSESLQIDLSNYASVLAANQPVVLVQVYNDWDHESIAFSQLWERAVEKLGSYILFGRVHEQKDARVVSTIIPVRIRLLPALALFIKGQFQRLIPIPPTYAEMNKQLVAAYPDKVTVLSSVDAIRTFLSGHGHRRVVVFTPKGQASMRLKHAALLLDGALEIGVTSVKPTIVHTELKVAGKPTTTNLILFNGDRSPLWQPIEDSSDLLPLLRLHLAQSVVSLSSAWQYHGVCRAHIDCIFLVKCSGGSRGSQITDAAFAAASENLRRRKLQVEQRPAQFITVDVSQVPAMKALCQDAEEKTDHTVVAIRDHQSMVVATGVHDEAGLRQWLKDVEERRHELGIRPAPTFYGERPADWLYRWAIGIALTVVLCAAVYVAIETGFVLVFTVVIMIGTVLSQLDWVPQLLNVFK